MSDEKVFGYGAIILPHLDEFQGFFLVESEQIDREAVKVQMMALAVQPQNVRAAIEAVMVEGYVTGKQYLVAAGARALWGITKKPFFYIVARKEFGGTRTEMFELSATTVEDAQIEVNELSLVNQIKNNLRTKVMKAKH